MQKRKKIDTKMPMAQLLELYPELASVLSYEYGLYCINCYIAEFDNLEEGAKLHGIDGEYFTEMITHLESIINSNEE